MEEQKTKECVVNKLIIEWEKNCHRLEVETISFREDIEESKNEKDYDRKLVKGKNKLNHILSSHKYPRNNASLGYYK